MNVWLTARGAGLSALCLLTIATCLGALAGRPGRRQQPGTRVVLQYVHRASAVLGLGVLALHVTTILIDPLAHVGVTGALIPFTSSYRATWVGLGTIAAYLLLAVAALGLARGRLAGSARGAAGWRTLHGFAYGAWGFALVHGYESGTDTAVPWVRVLFLACLAAVLICVARRLTPPADPVVARPPARTDVDRPTQPFATTRRS